MENICPHPPHRSSVQKNKPNLSRVNKHKLQRKKNSGLHINGEYLSHSFHPTQSRSMAQSLDARCHRWKLPATVAEVHPTISKKQCCTAHVVFFLVSTFKGLHSIRYVNPSVYVKANQIGQTLIVEYSISCSAVLCSRLIFDLNPNVTDEAKTQ